MSDNKVIVIGGDHHNTLGVIRALGTRGIKPVVVILSEDEIPYVSCSRYIHHCLRISDLNELVPCLLNLATTNEEKPVIICCHDAMSSELDKNSKALDGHFFFPHGPYPGSISQLMDKEVMGELAKSFGLSIPQKEGFPCIAKPKVSKNGNKEWIQVCRTPEELSACLAKYGQDNMQVQQYIDKVAEYQLIGCSLSDGNVIIPGVSSILRPCPGSNTSFLCYSGPDTIVDVNAVKRFVRATGYQGLFSVEFVRGPKGVDYFLEINFRNDGNAVCVTKAGVNLPYIWYLHSIGKDYSSEEYQRVKTTYVIPEFEELSLLTSHTITLSAFIHDFMKADAGMEFDFRDQKPFWVQLRRRLAKKFKRNVT